MFRCITIFLLIFLVPGVFDTLIAQNVQLYGAIPSVIFNGKIGDQWSYNLAFSSETNVIRREYGSRVFPAEVSNLNVEGALAHDLNPNLSLAGGFLYRARDPFNSGSRRELRPWQQLTLIHYLNAVRFRNRFRLEERITQQSTGSGIYDLDLRLRYRLSSDFPLQGERLDDREFYLNLSSEALVILNEAAVFSNWESRNYVGLGYQFNRRHRLEPALDFRTRRANEAGDRRNVLFLRVQWIVKMAARKKSGS